MTFNHILKALLRDVDYHARCDEIYPVQLFFLLTTDNPSYILFIRHKELFD